MKQLTGKFPLQGARNFIWDMIIEEVAMLRPYLNYILDKEKIIHDVKQSCTTVKAAFNKTPYTQQTIQLIF